MKNTLLAFSLLILFSINFIFCNPENKSTSFETNSNINNVDNQIVTNTSSFNYETVLKMGDSLCELFSVPKSIELDLNGDKNPEIFLPVETYSRGAGYVLFSKEGNGMKVISGDETVASGNAGIEKLDIVNSGWNDFVAYQASGREGIIESYYTWNGTVYVLKEQKEVSY